MERDRTIDQTVEAGLGSVGKLKILRLLLERPHHAFTRYEIGKTVANDPASIRSDLQTLVQIQWVSEFKVRHLSKYAINLNDEIVKHLATFFRELRRIP